MGSPGEEVVYSSAYVRVRSSGTERGLAVLELCREPANAMDLDVWSQLSAALKCVEARADMRALLFTSALQKEQVFSAGNDINELHAPSTTSERFFTFWKTLTQFLADLYVSRLVTVACVSGFCPAGGCVIALCCDLRVANSTAVIGLNESNLGIMPPKFWGELMMKTAGPAAEQLLVQGTLVGAQRALDLGLLHRVFADVSSRAELVRRGCECATQYLKASQSDTGRVLTKRHLRKPFADAWAAFAQEEAEQSWELLNRPEVVKQLTGVLKQLSGRKSRSNL